MNLIGFSLPRRAWSYYRTHGLAAFIRRTLQTFKNRSGTGLRSKSLREPVNLNPGKIHFHIDNPAEDLVAGNQNVQFSGWACAESGIESIDLYIDNVFVKQTRISCDRPDVAAAYPNIRNSLFSGFADFLDTAKLPAGQHQFLIAIHDASGNTVTHRKVIECIEDGKLYHNYFLKYLINLEDSIASEAASNADIKIEIWVDCRRFGCSTDTIESIAMQKYNKKVCKILAPKENHKEIFNLISSVRGEAQNLDFELHDTFDAPMEGNDLEYICFLESGETLTNHALGQFSKVVGDLKPDICYSDNDIVRPDGLHCEPNFKPDWSPDYMLSKNYVGGFYLCRKTIDSVKIIAAEVNRARPAWRYSLFIRLSGKEKKIHHIPHVLWSSSGRETRDMESLNDEADVIGESLSARGEDIRVTDVGKYIRKIERNITNEPKVTIIIPTTGNIKLLKPCVTSLLDITGYKNYELIFLNNGRGRNPDGIAFLKEKGIKVYNCDIPFNWSRLNNIGASKTSGELLLFLNDDIEVINGEWLEELVSNAIRPEIGAVGAMLLYPNQTIQHAGIFLVDHGGGARHYFHHANPENSIYQDLHLCTREVSSVTGACLMMRRDVFNEVGGFDEELGIVGNDVDMCLRIMKSGYRNIWTPHCKLIHHESISRKEVSVFDDEKRMWKRWENIFLKGDPFYNPNLSKTRSDCSLADLPKKIKLQNARNERESGRGVNLIGYIKAQMGLGEGVRAMAAAMETAGIPFGLVNYEKGNPARMGDETWSHRITNSAEHEISILFVTADSTPGAVRDLSAKYFSKRYTVGYWAWELPEFPDKWIGAFSHVNEVWVPSRFVQEAVAGKSPVPVVRIPVPVDKRKLPLLKREFFKLPTSSFLFLCMYDSHSIRERKNPLGAIHAFQKAFSADDAKVGLIIKVNNCGGADYRILNEQIRDYKNIHIIDQVLSRNEIDGLIACSDCFISLHRSEGYGLVIAEAMALNTPVIATNWSGNTDFMNQNNAACVDYELKRLEKNYGPYEAHQVWAEPDIDHAVWWMRQFVDNSEMAARLSRRARVDIETFLSPKAVGEKIKQRIKYICI